jgi:hypothetical protein
VSTRRIAILTCIGLVALAGCDCFRETRRDWRASPYAETDHSTCDPVLMFAVDTAREIGRRTKAAARGSGRDTVPGVRWDSPEGIRLRSGIEPP